MAHPAPRTRTALAVCALTASACSHAWDDYDPLLGTGGSATSSSAVTAGTGGGGATSSTSGPSSTSTTTTTTSSGAGGAASSSGAGGSGGSGGAGGGVMTNCSVSNGSDKITDAFNAAMVDPKWELYSFGGVALTQKGGEAVVTLGASSASSTFGHFQTAQTFDLTGCYALVHVTQTCDPATLGYGSLIASVGDDTYLEIIVSGGEIECKYTIGGTQTYVLPGTPFDPTNDAWWRLREAGGTSYWETSADGLAWKVRGSAPNPMPVTAMLLSIAGGTYQPEPIAPGEMHFDDFNLPP